MTVLHHVISYKLAAATAALMTVGAAAVVGSMKDMPRAAAAHAAALAPSWARAPIVPAGEPDLSTEWEATTDSRFRVLFTYHRADTGCSGPCEVFGLVLWFAEPSHGADPSARWLTVVHAGCATLTEEAGREDLCEARDMMAGRDRHGNDYVLLPLYATRGQLAGMLLSPTTSLELGGFRFSLSPAARSALRTFIGSAGRAVPR